MKEKRVWIPAYAGMTSVIPAKAGIQHWIPAYAGMTPFRFFLEVVFSLDSRLRGNDSVLRGNDSVLRGNDSVSQILGSKSS